MQTQLVPHNHISNCRQVASNSLAHRKHNLLLSAISMLSNREIQVMNRQDLLDVLKMVQSTSLRADATNIDNMEAPELRRVLAIVREHIGEHANRHSSENMWKPEYN